jgi:rubrerythrin
LSTAIGIDYIFDMAERIERNGRDFYLTAARMATDASARDMLTNLGEMEARHESTFAAMRARVVGAGEVTSLDPQSDIVIYLKSLVRGRFFDISADPGSYFAGGESLKDILLTAIGLEKETIALSSKTLSVRKWGTSPRWAGNCKYIGSPAAEHKQDRHTDVPHISPPGKKQPR